MKSSIIALAAAAGTAYAAQAPAYGQCSGQGWTGPTSCVSGYTCNTQNQYYGQCLPGTAAAAPKAAATTIAPKVASKAVATPAKATKTTAAAPKAATSKAATAAVSKAGKVQYAGINISGFDFGCGTDGSCNVGGIVDPGEIGISQMQHFVKDDKLNTFRLPVGWQYLVNNKLGGTLDAGNFANYDKQIQACLSIAELCIIDLHNYGRWNGAVVGQSNGQVTDAQFVSLWSQLATKYASSPKVAFGLMNEPHDMPSIDTWATTINLAVTAIRKAGATKNTILLPSNDWTHASMTVQDGSAAALSKITNLDGTTTGLVFDVHQYLDSDGSGTNPYCSTNNVEIFKTLATWLRTNKRMAILTETGGGSTDSSCQTAVCEMLQTLMANSDVYLGWTGWAAGRFDTSYALSETPSGSAGSWVDQPLVTKCIAGVFNSA